MDLTVDNALAFADHSLGGDQATGDHNQNGS